MTTRLACHRHPASTGVEAACKDSRILCKRARCARASPHADAHACMYVAVPACSCAHARPHCMCARVLALALSCFCSHAVMLAHAYAQNVLVLWLAKSRSLGYPHACLLACSLAGWLAHCLVPACPLTRPSTCSLARTLRWLACSCSARLSCSLRTLCKLSTLRMLRLLCLLCSLHLLTC